MTLATSSSTSGQAALPHWETVPDDLPAAVREVKAALRARIEASGRSVHEVFAVMEARVRTRVEEIAANKARGAAVWPEIDYADIVAGTVTTAALAALHKRGCLVVRGHFDRGQALGWDSEIVDYAERNQFFENYRGPADDFFGSVGSRPEIYPLYWSPPQMQARQSDRMAKVQTFLNAQWTSESDGVRWFDPGRDSLYPDRIRRRPEGADSAGLGTHLDPGTLDLWLTQAYQQAFRHLFDGTVEQYDPWDAAYRTAGPQYPDRPCAPRSGLSKAGPRCPTWTTTRASCTPSPSPRRWAISCSGPCSTTCPTTICAASPSTRSSPPAPPGIRC